MSEPIAEYGRSHEYRECYKLVRSGQTRCYYNAVCACGWRHRKRNGEPWFRVSKQDASADWDAHIDCSGADQ